MTLTNLVSLKSSLLGDLGRSLLSPSLRGEYLRSGDRGRGGVLPLGLLSLGLLGLSGDLARGGLLIRGGVLPLGRGDLGLIGDRARGGVLPLMGDRALTGDLARGGVLPLGGGLLGLALQFGTSRGGVRSLPRYGGLLDLLRERSRGW